MAHLSPSTLHPILDKRLFYIKLIRPFVCYWALIISLSLFYLLTDAQNAYSEIQWSECNALIIVSKCDIAAVLIDWFRGLKFNNNVSPSILLFEPDFLLCQVSTQGVLQLAESQGAMQAVAQVLLHGHLNWRKLILIHDSTIGRSLYFFSLNS